VERDLSVGCKELSRMHPRRALAIRLLALRDHRFREICLDYGEALSAAEASRSASPSKIGQAEEFEQIAEDLRAEALKYLAEPVEPSALRKQPGTERRRK